MIEFGVPSQLAGPLAIAVPLAVLLAAAAALGPGELTAAERLSLAVTADGTTEAQLRRCARQNDAQVAPAVIVELPCG